eukprot:gene16798-21237_t
MNTSWSLAAFVAASLCATSVLAQTAPTAPTKTPDPTIVADKAAITTDKAALATD